jgi:hypothetical protein
MVRHSERRALYLAVIVAPVDIVDNELTHLCIIAGLLLSLCKSSYGCWTSELITVNREGQVCVAVGTHPFECVVKLHGFALRIGNIDLIKGAQTNSNWLCICSCLRGPTHGIRRTLTLVDCDSNQVCAVLVMTDGTYVHMLILSC